MDKEYLQHILEKIMDNSATEEELRMYNAWCNTMQERNEAPDQSTVEDLQRETLQNIHRRMDATKLKKTVIRYLKYSAAAVLVGMAGLGVLTYRGQDRKSHAAPISQPVAVSKAKVDIVPGKNAATLTLANGQKITLSNMQAGQLATQNGMAISKTADNRLVYHMDSNSAHQALPTVVQYNILNTARGEQYSIVLPDGTKAWLNSASTLKFPTSFGGLAKREVELSGEAYFEVVENKKQPFAVRTSKQYVEDLGTHFNVSCYADDPAVKTTLLEGVVRINNEKTLKPGQQAVSFSAEVKVKNVNTDAVVSWKNGYFEFDDENIYDIMKQVARWYDVDVVYTGKMPTSTMEGSMTRFANVSSVLEIIQQTGLFTFRTAQRKIYVSSTFR